MKAKEKAEELTSAYFNLNMEWDGVINKEWAKEGALIALDEIIKAGKDVDEFAEFFWQEVKQEIEKL